MRGVRGGRDFGGAEGVLFLLFIYLFIGKGKRKRKSWQKRERGVWRACERLGLCRHKVKLTGCIG